MKIRSVFFAMVCALAFCALPTTLFAQDKKEAPPAPSPAEMEAMMKLYEKYATPGPQHKEFEQMVGHWEAVTQTWMAPGQPPMVTKGSSDFHLILGGRYLVQEFKGEFMGKPFAGFGITGYDNFKKQFTNTWVDTLSTVPLNTIGTTDATGKVVTYVGKWDDPVTNEKDKPAKMILKTVDANKQIFEYYDTIPNVGEVKIMEITYTRKK